MDKVRQIQNSLSTLLGQYMSDSDDEQQQQKITKSEVDLLKNEVASATPKRDNESQPTTYWTECLDQTTGHPYYWNTETKKVTWEKPSEYVEYLNFMKTAYAELPKDSWSIGYSDDSQTPYYVNEITRVVSWERPENFRETKVVTASNSDAIPILRLGGRKLERKTTKKRIKKPLPKHLQSNSDDDEKIELISAYGETVNSSSDDEDAKGSQVNKIVPAKSLQINLVAAYATDSDSDGGNDSRKVRIIGSVKNTNGSIIETIATESSMEKPNASSTHSNVSSPLNMNANSFASIITGGKTNDSAMDEELNKFKEELEKDMQILDAEDSLKSNTEVKEQSFDEKTFQRKRRIEFKTKSGDEQRDLQLQRPGFGCTDSKPAGVTGSSAALKLKSGFINFQKSHSEFERKSPPEENVYRKTLSPELIDSSNMEMTDTRPDCKTEIDDLCDVISGKVKFLSVGKSDVSAVQIMSIQFETLESAFRASCLDSDYFFKWLKTTSDNLLTLEQHAAPDGWECKWDRESSQYCYKNITTNVTQWEFPYEGTKEDATLTKDAEPEAIRGDDEMDISTTPPPPSPPQISGNSAITGLAWDLDHSITKPEPLEPGTDNSYRLNNISGELASFYSDIATLDPTGSSVFQTEIADAQEKTSESLKRINDEITGRKLKKRKKIKVPGLGSKMQEVSSMVANWQKAQKELES